MQQIERERRGLAPKAYLAVFDLDHTLLSANSSFHFVAFLYRRGVISTWCVLEVLSAYLRHKWFGLSMLSLHRKTFPCLFQGKNKREISALASEFCHAYLKDLISLPVVSRLKEALEAGHESIILSSSPAFLVKAIAEHLDVTHWRATEFAENAAGEYTSLDSVFEGQDKADYLSYLMRERSLPSSAVTVYSDSALDLPLLKLAGRAVCVRPDRTLRRVGKKLGWEVL